MQELLSTLAAPDHRRPGALSPGNGGWSARRSPRASAGSGGPGGAPPRTRGLRPSRLGRGRSRQSCRGWPGYARRESDGDSPVPRGPSRGFGPWITAEWPWSPTGRGCTVLPEGNWSQAATGPVRGWGGPGAARAGARGSAGSSFPPSPSVPTLLPLFARSGLWGATPGPRSRGGGSAWLRRPRPTAALPAPCPHWLCGAERSWAERGAHCSLAFRKATLAAGRRDAGLTHARARVNARLLGCERGSDGRHKQRGGQGAEGLPGAAS